LSKPDTLTDTVWKSYPKIIRKARLITDWFARQEYCKALLSSGIVFDKAIVQWDWTAEDAMNARIESGVNQPGLPPPSLDPADYPIAVDLVASGKPFQYSFHVIGTGDVGSSYNPNDTMEIGAEWYTDGEVYEKLVVSPRPSDLANASADPRLANEVLLVTLWFRVQ